MDEKRSNNMKAIKGKDTSLELKVRKYLYHHGFRYRKNVRRLPGTPDIVIDKYHVCIFVNGCFWHHHYHCKLATVPKSHHDYWVKKIERTTIYWNKWIIGFLLSGNVKSRMLLKQQWKIL